jgi:putative redox protein
MSNASRHQPIVVTHEGGVRFAAQVRSHRVIVDQPPEAGGEDAGPMPLELIATSLATCIALYVQQYLHSRGVPHEGMRVEVGQRGARNPNRVGEFDVRVVVPGLPSEHAEMLERVARSCPAHNTLIHGAHVQVAIEAPAPVGA